MSSFVSNAGYQFEILNVQQEYCPSVQSSSCGISNRLNLHQTHAALQTITFHPAYEDEEQINLSLAHLRVHIFLTEESKPLFQTGWDDRIKMIQEVFETASIFSLSIIPANPEEKQTVYVKKARVERPAGLRLDRSQMEKGEHSLSNQFPGFLIPFTHYTSTTYKAETTLKGYTIYTLNEALSQQGGFTKILTHFAADIHSLAIALILLLPQEGRIERVLIRK